MNGIFSSMISGSMSSWMLAQAAADAVLESPDVLQQLKAVLETDFSTAMMIRVVTRWVPSLLAALLVFLAGRVLSRVATRMIDQADRKSVV